VPTRWPEPRPDRDTFPPLPADLVLALSATHAVYASLVDHRNSLPSRSIRWRITESLRATATVAFLVPILLARRVPQGQGIGALHEVAHDRVRVSLEGSAISPDWATERMTCHASHLWRGDWIAIAEEPNRRDIRPGLSQHENGPQPVGEIRICSASGC
jgi:hypothetical protein